MGKIHRNKKISLAALFLVPIIVSTIGFTIYGVVNDKVYLNSLYAQGEIVILNDNDFSERHSLPGSGTAENPFLIENYIFKNPKTVAIVIKDTSKHFIIRNCSVQKQGQPLYISNIGFNTGTVINNTFIEDMTLVDNIKFHDYRDDRNSWNHYNYQPYRSGFIFIYNSPGIRIENNLFQFSSNETAKQFDYGLVLVSSDYSFINNNSVSFFSHGILIFDSLYMNIINNFCSNNDNGIFIDNVKEALIMNNICTNNTNGIEISNDYSYEYSERVLIIANNLSYNTNAGIFTEWTNNYCQIKGNFICGNEFGLSGSLTESNITYNYFSLNNNHSIRLNQYSYSNYIHHNVFIENNYEGLLLGLKQAFDVTLYTNEVDYWFENSTKEGNYWSDFIWNENAVYHLDGGNTTDQYPLLEPPTIELWEVLS